MCWVNGQGGMAATGTTLHIDAHRTLDDGRMLVENTGQRRFRVVDVVQERPVLVCDVEYLDGEEEEGEGELKELGAEVMQLFQNVLDLNFKLKDMDAEELAGKIDFAAKERMGPREISFWIASMFSDAESEQQFLLEMESTELRLQREKSLLAEAQKYLSAQSALKGVFAVGGEDEADGPGLMP